jgi:hypothetical protein
MCGGSASARPTDGSPAESLKIGQYAGPEPKHAAQCTGRTRAGLRIRATLLCERLSLRRDRQRGVICLLHDDGDSDEPFGSRRRVVVDVLVVAYEGHCAAGAADIDH